MAAAARPEIEQSAEPRAPRVGVLGAGQLGRMLALAGAPLGVRFTFLDPAPDAPAGRVGEQIVAEYTDKGALARLGDVDVVTYEFESVPESAAAALAARRPLYPSAEALAVAQDRALEKSCFRALGIPTSDFELVGTPGAAAEAELERALTLVGLPAVLKTRRLGYDGKGQWLLRQRADVDDARAAFSGAPAILEKFVAFDRELSILGVRGQDGETRFYPLVENQHRDGILRLTRAPAAGVTPDLASLAEGYARALLERFEYVGVLALELFQVGQQLFANEMAPRVHNSGHFSIEGARTSQFENHLRAILGWPLGATDVPAPCAMLNIVGELPETSAVLALPGTHLHLYDKAPRPGRKLGHVTIMARDTAELEESIARLRAMPGVG